MTHNEAIEGTLDAIQEHAEAMRKEEIARERNMKIIKAAGLGLGIAAAGYFIGRRYKMDMKTVYIYATLAAFGKTMDWCDETLGTDNNARYKEWSEANPEKIINYKQALELKGVK